MSGVEQGVIVNLYAIGFTISCMLWTLVVWSLATHREKQQSKKRGE